MKNLLTLFAAALLFHTSLAQSADEPQNSRYSLLLRGGAMRTSLFDPTFYVFACFEGCWASKQEPLNLPAFNAGVAYELSKRSRLAVLTGYSEFGYHEEGFSSGPGSGGNPPYAIDRVWKFWGLEGEHTFKLMAAGRVSLLLGNALRLETSLNDGSKDSNLKIIRTLNASYSGRLGAEVQLTRNLSLQGNGIFKTAIARYNKAAPVFDNNDYWPWAVGGELGLRMKI